MKALSHLSVYQSTSLPFLLFSNTVDDEEEMLYGDCNPAGITPTKDESHPGYRPSGALGGGSEGRSGRAEPTHWCMMVRENGVMEVRIDV